MGEDSAGPSASALASLSPSGAPPVSPADSIPLGPPKRFAAPDGLRLKDLAVAKTRVFAIVEPVAGGDRELRVGEVAGEALTWRDRVVLRLPSDAASAFDPEFAEGASMGRVAVARRGTDWHASFLVVDESNGRWKKEEAVPPWRRDGAGGFEFEYGTPSIVRGDELFMLSFPGARIDHGTKQTESSSAFLHFHHDAAGWHGAAIPFVSAATDLGWSIVFAPDGASVGVLTEHGPARALDLYRRDGSSFVPTSSLDLPADTATVIRSRSRLVALGREITVFKEAGAGWVEERRIRLPDSESTAKGQATGLVPIVSNDRLIAQRADGWLFDLDLAGEGRVRRLLFPKEIDARKITNLSIEQDRLWGLSGNDQVVAWAMPAL
jgi:hypothetical protein